VKDKPNIVAVGVIGGVAIGAPTAQMLLWLYKSILVPDGWPPFDAETATAFGSLVTALVATIAQWHDRQQKRATGYVVTKYADQMPGRPPDA
jgi:hypothetical protein